MIDEQIHTLLTQAVNTPIKLHLVIYFHEHSNLVITSAEIAERFCRDIWSITQALSELAEAGILQIANQVAQESQPPIYQYRPRSEYIAPLQTLIHAYNDPLRRDRLRRSVRDLAHFGAFQRGDMRELVY